MDLDPTKLSQEEATALVESFLAELDRLPESRRTIADFRDESATWLFWVFRLPGGPEDFEIVEINSGGLCVLVH